MSNGVKAIIAIVLIFAVGLICFGVYDKITNLNSLPEQTQPNIPNFDVTEDEDGLPNYILNSSYHVGSSDFALPRVNETRGEKFDITLYNYANFIVYSSAGVSDTRGLIETVDYQPFKRATNGGATYYLNGDDKCSDLGGFKQNEYYFKVSKKSVAYALGDNKTTVGDIKAETSYCNRLFAPRCVEFTYQSNQTDFERYADVSYFKVNNKVYKMTFRNGYLQSMDVVFKSILNNYTNAKNGDTYANFVCLNDLVLLEEFNTTNGEVIPLEHDVNILMPFSVSFLSRINCDNDFALSNNMSLNFN